MGRKRVIGLGILAAAAVTLLLFETGAIPRPAALGHETADSGAGPQPVDGDAVPAGDDEPDSPAPSLARAPGAGSAPRGAAGDDPRVVREPGGPEKPPTVAFAGAVVRADGKPAGRAQVVANGRLGVVVEGTADADGRFHLDLAPGRYDLVFRSQTDGALLVRGYVVDGSAGAAPFRLGGGSEIRVEVTRGGEPVSGATVEASLAYGDRGDHVAHGSTDSAGVFTADAVPAGPYRVEVWPGGEPETIVTEQGALPPPLAVTRSVEVSGRVVVPFDLPSTVHVSGVVTDADTKAGVNALVEIVVALDSSTVTGFTRSDDAGAYVVEVPAGRVRSFRVDDWKHAPYPPSTEEKALLDALLPLRAGKDVVKDVVLSLGSRLSGTVTTGPDKTPVPGLWLRFENRAGQVLRTAPTNVTGGYLVLALPVGEAVVTLESPGWYLAKPGRTTVTLAAPAAGGETTLDLEVVASGVVGGFVVGADGSPVSGAVVRTIGGGLAGRDARRVGRVLEATARSDGYFSLTEVPPAVDVRVEASLGETKSVPSAAFRLPDGDPSPLRLVLGGTGRLTGRVIDLSTREPIAATRVRIDPVGDPAGRGGRSLVTDADGRFEAGGFVPGGWRLTPVARTGVYLPGAPRDVELGTDLRDVIVDLPLDPGRVVAGTVLDAAGAPVGGARVALSGTADGASSAVSRRATTDGEGRFRIAGLSSGSYALDASRRGFVSAGIRGLRGGEERLVLRMTAADAAAGGGK